jgi:hypothetical protein
VNPLRRIEQEVLARGHWGLLPYGRKSPELQARLAYTATVVGSYADAETMTW